MFAERTGVTPGDLAAGRSQTEVAQQHRFRCACCGQMVDGAEVRYLLGRLSHGHESACGPVLREPEPVPFRAADSPQL